MIGLGLLSSILVMDIQRAKNSLEPFLAKNIDRRGRGEETTGGKATRIGGNERGVVEPRQQREKPCQWDKGLKRSVSASGSSSGLENEAQTLKVGNTIFINDRERETRLSRCAWPLRAKTEPTNDSLPIARAALPTCITRDKI